jgi:hypothetical protein
MASRNDHYNSFLTTIFLQNLAFSMLKAALFSRKFQKVFFIVDLCIPLLKTDLNSVLEPEPVQGWGFAKVESCGFGSTTLLMTWFLCELLNTWVVGLTRAVLYVINIAIHV